MCLFGTRPEAVKLAPVIEELKRYPNVHVIVGLTGQHRTMLDEILGLDGFNITADFDLKLMRPNQQLDELSSKALEAVSRSIRAIGPEAILVQGDTTTAMIAGIAAMNLRVPVIAHVEAGLRTWDRHRPFPEENNRRLLAVLSTLHFSPTLHSAENLQKEFHDPRTIIVTGNTVIDALFAMINRETSHESLRNTLRLIEKESRELQDESKIILVTSHRRENFGEPLRNICDAILRIHNEHPNVITVFPVHLNPNVRNVVLPRLGNRSRILLVEPLPYMPFVQLMKHVDIVLTDSGGIQEEATGLGKPILIMRTKTERPEGVHAGVAKLVGIEGDLIFQEVHKLLVDSQAYGLMARRVFPYGDGLASERIAYRLVSNLVDRKSLNFFASGLPEMGSLVRIRDFKIFRDLCEQPQSDFDPNQRAGHLSESEILMCWQKAYIWSRILNGIYPLGSRVDSQEDDRALILHLDKQTNVDDQQGSQACVNPFAEWLSQKLNEDLALVEIFQEGPKQGSGDGTCPITYHRGSLNYWGMNVDKTYDIIYSFPLLMPKTSNAIGTWIREIHRITKLQGLLMFCVDVSAGQYEALWQLGKMLDFYGFREEIEGNDVSFTSVIAKASNRPSSFPTCHTFRSTRLTEIQDVINHEDPISEKIPRVSIILPVYNAMEFLPDLIGQVFKQEYKDFELIIVNDGSTDTTSDYLKSLEGKQRIKIIHQQNQRLPSALNRGFAEARGTYLTWISADNWLLSNFLSRLVTALDTYPEADFAHSDHRVIDDMDAHLMFHIDPHRMDYGLMFGGNTGMMSFMYTRRCMEKVGSYDTSLEGVEDHDYWTRVLEKCGPVVYVPEVLAVYRKHRKSLSATLVIRGTERLAFQKLMQRNKFALDPATISPGCLFVINEAIARGDAYYKAGTRIYQISWTKNHTDLVELSRHFFEECYRQNRSEHYVCGLNIEMMKSGEKDMQILQEVSNATDLHIDYLQKTIDDLRRRRGLFARLIEMTELMVRQRMLDYAYTLDSDHHYHDFGMNSGHKNRTLVYLFDSDFTAPTMPFLENLISYDLVFDTIYLFTLGKVESPFLNISNVIIAPISEEELAVFLQREEIDIVRVFTTERACKIASQRRNFRTRYVLELTEDQVFLLPNCSGSFDFIAVESRSLARQLLSQGLPMERILLKPQIPDPSILHAFHARMAEPVKYTLLCYLNAHDLSSDSHLDRILAIMRDIGTSKKSAIILDEPGQKIELSSLIEEKGLLDQIDILVTDSGAEHSQLFREGEILLALGRANNTLESTSYITNALQEGLVVLFSGIDTTFWNIRHGQNGYILDDDNSVGHASTIIQNLLENPHTRASIRTNAVETIFRQESERFLKVMSMIYRIILRNSLPSIDVGKQDNKMTITTRQYCAGGGIDIYQNGLQMRTIPMNCLNDLYSLVNNGANMTLENKRLLKSHPSHVIIDHSWTDPSHEDFPTLM